MLRAAQGRSGPPRLVRTRWGAAWPRVRESPCACPCGSAAQRGTPFTGNKRSAQPPLPRVLGLRLELGLQLVLQASVGLPSALSPAAARSRAPGLTNTNRLPPLHRSRPVLVNGYRNLPALQPFPAASPLTLLGAGARRPGTSPSLGQRGPCCWLWGLRSCLGTGCWPHGAAHPEGSGRVAWPSAPGSTCLTFSGNPGSIFPPSPDPATQRKGRGPATSTAQGLPVGQGLWAG